MDFRNNKKNKGNKAMNTSSCMRRKVSQLYRKDTEEPKQSGKKDQTKKI